MSDYGFIDIGILLERLDELKPKPPNPQELEDDGTGDRYCDGYYQAIRDVRNIIDFPYVKKK